jgi:hypothetical protein
LNPRPANVERAESLFRRGLSPSELFRHAASHRLGTILLGHAESGRVPFLPDEVVDELRLWAAAREVVAQQQEEAAREVAALLDGHGVAYAFMKGAALVAAGIYGNFATRPMVDIDFLIDPPAVRSVIDLMTARGYTPLADRHDLSSILARRELEFRKDGCDVVEVEFSLRVAKDFPLVGWMGPDAERMLERRVAVDWNGSTVYVPSPRDLFMHLLYHHVLINYCQSLSYWTDLLGVIERFADRLPAEEIIRQAAAWRISRPLALVAKVLHDRFGAPLSPTPGVPEFTHRFFFGRDDRMPVPAFVRAKRQFVRLDLIDGFGSKGRVVWRYLFDRHPGK